MYTNIRYNGENKPTWEKKTKASFLEEKKEERFWKFDWASESNKKSN